MKRISFAIILTAALFTGAAALRAQPTIASIQSEFLDVQNNLQTAAADFTAGIFSNGVQTATITDLDSALTNLDIIMVNITNASIQTALGKKYKTIEHSISNHIVSAEKTINNVITLVNKYSGATLTSDEKDSDNLPWSKSITILGDISAGTQGILSGGLLLGKPLLANKDGNAGFYHPGAFAHFQIDTAGCGETPSVTVQNASSLTSPIDTSFVPTISPTGEVTFKMGTVWGGGRITVTACGQSSTLLVYNYGKEPVAGVPLDFPQTLPTGKYVMTYTASGAVNIGSTAIGTFNMTGLKAFYDAITRAFTTAINAVSSPDCSQGVSYSPYSDNSFSVTYTVTCSSGGESASESLTFTLTKE